MTRTILSKRTGRVLTVTNSARALWAKRALQAFNKETRTMGPITKMHTDDKQDLLSDLLADLQHCADVEGLDFNYAMACANTNYLAEKEESK